MKRELRGKRKRGRGREEARKRARVGQKESLKIALLALMMKEGPQAKEQRQPLEQ